MNIPEYVETQEESSQCPSDMGGIPNLVAQ
jgi:hypothetical protein